MPDVSLFWVGFCRGESECWHICNSKQYNHYEKCDLISFQKVCHYLKKNVYRANTFIKIHKVLTYLAMSPTDRLFFICLHFYNLILTWKWFIFECGKQKNYVNLISLSSVYLILCQSFYTCYASEALRFCSFIPLTIFIVYIHTHPPLTHKHPHIKSWHTALTSPLDYHFQINRCDTEYVIAPLFK